MSVHHLHSDTHYVCASHSAPSPSHTAYHIHISQSHILMHCTHKSTGVVIANGVGIAEGLQHRIGKQQKILHFLDIFKVACDVGNVAHDDLGSLCLASSTLTCVYKQQRAGNHLRFCLWSSPPRKFITCPIFSQWCMIERNVQKEKLPTLFVIAPVPMMLLIARLHLKYRCIKGATPCSPVMTIHESFCSLFISW